MEESSSKGISNKQNEDDSAAQQVVSSEETSSNNNTSSQQQLQQEPTPPSPSNQSPLTTPSELHPRSLPQRSSSVDTSARQSTSRSSSSSPPSMSRSSAAPGGVHKNKATTTTTTTTAATARIHLRPDPKKTSSSSVASPPHPTPAKDLITELCRPLPLPVPRIPSKCPLFCCFYAEFDNKIGPKLSHQSPQHFMDQDINGIPMDKIHCILQEAFDEILKRSEEEKKGGSSVVDVTPPAETWSNSSDKEDGSDNDNDDDEESLSREGRLSIFRATSEYIITGSELAGKMINLSTHDMHILTRPTVISDETYERNALLFSVGFVLRRTEDPRPFRPLLNKWAEALVSAELESQFLTRRPPELKTRLQPLLDRLLVSLNSPPRMECNLLLDSANWVNLKLFRAPKPPAGPVPDHAVPVLIREDLLTLYDWDLAIKWIVLHIDGVSNARMIAARADVDMEMARACLRVLKHHGVIALLDMFFYSNRYECTERAAAMLAGKEPKLLQEALDYVAKARRAESTPQHAKGSNENLPTISQVDGALPVEEMYSSFPPTFQSLSSSLRSPSFRLPGSIPASHELVHSTMVRKEAKMLKTALAELYCSCQRNMTFSEVQLNKMRGSSSSTSFRRDTSSPLPNGDQTNHLFNSQSSGQLEGKASTASPAIDWKAALHRFDHRRFVTFGLVNGLLVRIHSYPFVVEKTNGSGLSPTQNGVRNKRDMNSESGSDQTEKRLALQIASKMDGTRCDDELMCQFEKPIHELEEMVRKSLNVDLLSIFSAR